ncbi:MAG: Na(+)/H(+) antiporter subunit D [Gammaproteobacteria bacterium]|nr:Na(+)/H(+) antiporter subunit D [Gammaproteobacteria bacterium]
MIDGLNPAFILLGAAPILPLLPLTARRVLMLAAPVLGFLQLTGLPYGEQGLIYAYGLEFVTLRVDGLSFVFGVVFHLAALLGAIYALHVRDTIQHVAALVYSGAAIGALFAGDLFTLFVYWETTAIASVFLIWARRTEPAFRAGMRYLVIQVTSGVMLLAGAMVFYQQTGGTAFNHIGLESPAGVLIFLAFGIKCAFPFLHNWLQDSYPHGTVSGTVILSVFTTKLAVYALARGFAGEQILIVIGVVMTAFPIFFAVIENDLRRVLSYSLNNQLGFMVVGIGVGTEMGINGTAAHAFAHILYKALLFMSMGAVLFRAGTVKASELGGLYKSMPWTAGFCIIGSASISAFPLLSGFVSKSIILAATAEEHHWIAFLVLLFASAGVLDHSGIKVPYFSFFHRDSGIRCKEAPTSMLIAMGATAFLCIAIGVHPAPLYAILPYPVSFEPYTLSHVVTQMQLLMFSMLAFTVLMRAGLYPPEIRSVNLDFDCVYRKAIPLAFSKLETATRTERLRFLEAGNAPLYMTASWLRRLHGPRGMLARYHTTSTMLLSVLGAFLILLLIVLVS